MARYSVAFQVFASMFIEVEANSEEEAREKAESEAFEPTLCHQCSNEVQIDALGDILSIDNMED